MVPKKLLVTITVTGALLLAASHVANAQAPSSAGRFLVKSTPAFAATAKNLGPTDPAQTISVGLWLNVHNRQDLDTLAEQLYDRNSSNYHHWLTRKDLISKYAPTGDEAAKVQQYLTSKGLSNVSIGPDNFFVRGQGTVAVIEKAFRVQLNEYQLKDQVLRANAGDAFVESSVASLVRSVAGLSSTSFQHHNISRESIMQKLGKNPRPTAAATAAPEEAFFSSTCFTPVKTEKFNSGGSYPGASYTGNGYNSTSTGCGFAPADIRKAYNLDGLYKEGFDGAGQTIVIIDWCGSPTIRQDANAFSARFGLPPLTDANFNIIDYPTKSTCGGVDPEINIDVEWAHAIAPGANITLLVPPSSSFADIDAAQVYAEIYGLGSVISGSYGAEEYYVDELEVLNQNLISEIGALLGISANFSTGDDGDFTFDYPEYFVPSVSVPAASPYATGVGGVSLSLTKAGSIGWQFGWGTNLTFLQDTGYVYDPPYNYGFYFGSGGGDSGVFAKPYYQNHLSGQARKLPDVSWLADPYTPAIIAITEPFTYPIIYTTYGGTSLACPMFSALWAIANQEAGQLLGQAAPYLYSMPNGTIADVLALTSTTNVTGAVYSGPNAVTYYSAADLASPLEGTTKFFSALWDYPDADNTTYLLTFGTDSGLKTTTGWDNVTGVGTPNAKAFADYFNPANY